MAKTRLPEVNAEMVRARSGGMCEAQVPAGVCEGRASHLHHRKFRSGGEDHSVPNLLDACQPCHDFFHANKRTAMRYGWAITSHTGFPATEHPVLYRGQLSHLTADGGVERVPVPHVSRPVDQDPWKGLSAE